METVTDFILLGSKVQRVTESLKIKTRFLLGRKSMTNLDSILKQRHYFAGKDPSSQIYGFSSSHVWMWELDHKESWVPKNWCFWTVVLKKTLEGPLDSKEVKPVYPKGNQSWIFIGRTPKLWYFGHLMRRAYSLEKILMLGKTEGRRRRGWQDEMLGCHHWLNRHEFGQAPGVGDGQGSLVCCSRWGHKESDMTEQLNWWRN